ncbi:MAG TPA: TetR/AcrR family transcriptional regulator [Thermoanaerobaculia bacterium]|nr:TetR/AcrR family transcriptional regulator [Thermoanaerobaculia bacterium]
MRYGAEHKQRTRRRIVEAGARRFRESGYRAAGVDQVMKDAGLTAGGFYAHFSSKEALLAETLGLSLEEVRSRLLGGLEELEGVEWLQAVVRRYLSRSHRDQPGAGCPLPTLGSEIAREGEGPRLALQSYLQQIVAELAPRTPAAPGLDPEDRVLATAALLAGALMLARAVPDEALSDRILRAARRLALPETSEPKGT